MGQRIKERSHSFQQEVILLLGSLLSLHSCLPSNKKLFFDHEEDIEYKNGAR